MVPQHTGSSLIQKTSHEHYSQTVMRVILCGSCGCDVVCEMGITVRVEHTGKSHNVSMDTRYQFFATRGSNPLYVAKSIKSFRLLAGSYHFSVIKMKIISNKKKRIKRRNVIVRR